MTGASCREWGKKSKVQTIFGDDHENHDDGHDEDDEDNNDDDDNRFLSNIYIIYSGISNDVKMKMIPAIILGSPLRLYKSYIYYDIDITNK